MAAIARAVVRFPGEIPAPRIAQPRRCTAAKRKADELGQIENRPSGLVNRTVRDAARADAFAWDANGRRLQAKKFLVFILLFWQNLVRVVEVSAASASNQNQSINQR